MNYFKFFINQKFKKCNKFILQKVYNGDSQYDKLPYFCRVDVTPNINEWCKEFIFYDKIKKSSIKEVIDEKSKAKSKGYSVNREIFNVDVRKKWNQFKYEFKEDNAEIYIYLYKSDYIIFFIDNLNKLYSYKSYILSELNVNTFNDNLKTIIGSNKYREYIINQI